MQQKTATSVLIVAITLGFVLVCGCNNQPASQPVPKAPSPSPTANSGPRYHLGFDRNEYPGDDVLPQLRQTFDFVGYWLNNPPGEKVNNWVGKRAILREHGFGFAVLFNGRLAHELKGPNRASLYGIRDAKEAVASARHEGFPRETIIFLDQEQGGRLLKEQRAYLHAWIDTVTASGYRSGLYCSGIGFSEPESGETIVTAEDIRKNAGGRKIVYWVYNDQCGPSPGCSFTRDPAAPSASGMDFADLWQFAQSPKRQEAASCPKNYAPDGSCYAPGTSTYVDVNTATSADPSRGR